MMRFSTAISCPSEMNGKSQAKKTAPLKEVRTRVTGLIFTLSNLFNLSVRQKFGKCHFSAIVNFIKIFKINNIAKS